MLKFEEKLSGKEVRLARRINVRLKRLSDGKFLSLPGGGTEVSLARLYRWRDMRNSDAFAFDKISGGKNSRHDYAFVFEFSPSAGNRFQGKKTQFDLSLGIQAKSTGVCRNCYCWWKNYCCHPSQWSCGIIKRLIQP